jgi:hypothetical protein
MLIFPPLGKLALDGAEFLPTWKPLGTLWKDFSSFFPFLGVRALSLLAEGQFYRHMLCIFSRLNESRFKNLSSGLNTLWKPDCDCSSESLRAAMGTLWR